MFFETQSIYMMLGSFESFKINRFNLLATGDLHSKGTDLICSGNVSKSVRTR